MSDLSDWAAISISVVALGYGIIEARQTRTHNRLSVAPRLTKDASIVPGAANAWMRLTNMGLGPALITGFRLFIDGKTREQLKIHRFDQLSAHLGLAKDVVYSYPLVSEALAINTPVDLITVPVGTWSATRSGEIRAAFRRLRFEVDYQSLYGEKSTTFVLDGADMYPDELQGIPNARLPSELQD